MAVMWTLVIKNNGGSDQIIEDLGISIPSTSQLTLSDQFNYARLCDSDYLRDLVSAGTLVVNDGISDLSAANGVLYLTIQNTKDLEEKYYTKIELSASGNSIIHWDNITGAPSFGSPTWIDPVLYRVLNIDLGVAPGSPTTGDLYVDNNGAGVHYWKYNGSTWDDLGAASDTDRIVNLGDSTASIYTYVLSTNSWTNEGLPLNETGVLVNDDGDGKQAQYVYDGTSTSWKKIADVDFASHFDGGPSKHDSSEIDVEGTYINLTTTDLETVIGEIDGHLTNALVHNTLDMAYDEGGAGIGRTINVTDGSFVLNKGAATNAPFEIPSSGAAATSGLSSGQIDTIDHILCIYDSVRSKWLSVQRMFLVFGIRSGGGMGTTNQFMEFYAGSLTSNNSGLRMARNATIVSLAGQLDASGTCTMQIRKNDAATVISSLTITAALGAQDTAINVDLVAGDFLQSYLSNTNAVEDPMFMVEIAWNLT